MPYLIKLAKSEKGKDAAWEVFHYRDGESLVARRFAESSVATLSATLGLAGQLGAHAQKVTQPAADGKGPKDAKATGDGLDFAAFDCYACHHDLKSPSDRQERGYEGIPGRPYFRQAPFVLARLVVEHAAEMEGGAGLKDQAKALDDLQKELA